MKFINNYLPSVAQVVNINHVYTKSDGLQQIVHKPSKSKRLGQLCILMPDSYLQVRRTIKASNPLDLFKLAQLEAKRVSPFPAQVCWQLCELHANQAIIDFFCVPNEIAKEISRSCNYIYPVIDERSAAEKLLSEDENQSATTFSYKQALEQLESLGAWSLVGFKVAAADKARKEFISMKKALVISAIIGITYVGISSLYLSYRVSALEEQIAQQAPLVEEALATQRKAQEMGDSFKQLQLFMRENQSALPLLSSFDLGDSRYTLNRIEVYPTSMALYGETRDSATDLLQAVNQSPQLTEVKFGLPVNSRRGKELFIIESERKNGIE